MHFTIGKSTITELYRGGNDLSAVQKKSDASRII